MMRGPRPPTRIRPRAARDRRGLLPLEPRSTQASAAFTHHRLLYARPLYLSAAVQRSSTVIRLLHCPLQLRGPMVGTSVRVVALCSLCTASMGSPTAYWTSSPNMPGETVTVSGAFAGTFALALCDSPAPASEAGAGKCRTVDGPTEIWNHSVKFTLPASQTPGPTWLHVTQTGGSGAEALAVPINAPDVWWAAVLDASGIPNTAALPAVSSGSALRTFGRSLAWDAEGKCVSAQARAASTSTSLVLAPAAATDSAASATAMPSKMVISSLNATCFEAAFALGGVSPGHYTAKIDTVWGSSASFPLEVASTPPAPPVVTEISVDGDFSGDVVKALAHAAHVSGTARVHLSAKTYDLKTALTIGNHTQLVGSGAATTILRFALDTAPDGGEACGSRLYENMDLYVPGSDNPWSDIAYINNVHALSQCCDACKQNPSCNAYALMKSEGRCQLKRCSLSNEASCVAMNSTNTDRTASFLQPFRSPAPRFSGAAIVANGKHWALRNFTVLITAAPPKTDGIQSTGGTDFAIDGLSVQLSQANATSALKLDGTRRFSVSHTILAQNELCFWGCTLNRTDNTSDCTMTDSNTDFTDSSTLQMHAATWGRLHHNTIDWKCSAYDMDVSSNIIFEDNTIMSTQPGVIPHGNSISFYDWQHYPAASNWSFSHNDMSRPVNNDHKNWNSHETLTTDGPGGFGAGPLAAISDDRATLTLGFALFSEALSPVGGTAMVCGGSGMGQHAEIIGMSFDSSSSRNLTLLQLMRPFDAHVMPGGGSTICVTATVGSKIVSGNSFTWGMVVQWFGTTMRGVIADNDFNDCNVDGGRGAIMGFGLCYDGPQPMWACEYTGNKMQRSNGITLSDNVATTGLYCNSSTYGGPYARWQIIRRNSISGVALSASEVNATSPPCGTIFAPSVSSDVVVERNVFNCPPGSVQPPISAQCDHCLVSK